MSIKTKDLRIVVVAADGQLRFAKTKLKNGAKRYFALDIGGTVPSPEELKVLFDFVKACAKDLNK